MINEREVGNDLINRVEDALDTVRPYLEADRGNIEVVEITDDLIVKVKLTGTCETCPMSYMTMKAGVEQALISAIPEIKAVQAINVAN